MENLIKTTVIDKGLEVETLIFSTEKHGDVTLKIQKPGFNETVESFRNLSDANGNIDMIMPGKLIFDLCCLEHSPICLTDHQLMITICSQLTARYVLPESVELKKN